MRKLVLTAMVCVICLAGSAAFGQQIDAALGFGSATNTGGVSGATTSLGTGTWMSLGASFLIKKHLGFGGEAAWRASQNEFVVQNAAFGAFVQPFRPILYDFNGVYGTQFGKYAGADLMAGIGGASIRYYGQVSCSSLSGCVNYVSSNHFLGHFGGRLKFYPTKGNIFIAPEAHLYLIHGVPSITDPFNSGHLTRFGIAIGYTFRPGE